MKDRRTLQQLETELKATQIRLEEAEETLWAIQNNEVDALVVEGPQGQQVFTLQGAEQPYRTLMETMSEGALTISADGTILYCNSRFSELAKLPLNNIIGESLHNFLISGNGHSLEATLHECGREGCREEFILKSAQGQDVPVSLSARPLVLGDVEAFCIVVTDLTDQKRIQTTLEKSRDLLEEKVAERTAELSQANISLQEEVNERMQAEIALREAEERWATTLMSIGDAVIATDASARITFMNAVAENLTGWTFSDASRKPVADIFRIINEHTRREVENPVAKVLQEGMILGLANHTILIRKDGTEVAIDDSGAPIRNADGKITGVVLVFRDITDRRRVEDEILNQTRLLSGINRLFHEAITSKSEEELGAACLSVAQELTGSKIGFIGEVHPDGRLYGITISNPRWDICSLNNKNGHSGPVEPFKIHGLYGQVLTHGRSLLTNDPASHPESIGLPKAHPPLTAFLGVPLIENEKTIGLIAVGNREAGYSLEQQQILEALAPAVVQVFLRMRAEEVVRKSRDELELRVQERTNELNEAYETIQRELAERKKMEEQLIRTQKLEALGTLSGGIAHDFNNILAGIIGFTEMVMEDVAPDGPDYRKLEMALKGANRGRDLVKQILSFSRQAGQDRVPLTLSKIVKEGLQLLRPALPSTIEIVSKNSTADDRILADPVQMHQILMNLCTNAAHAMRERAGILEIDISKVSVANGSLAPVPEMSPGEYVVLQVRDTGTGMTPEVMERIFDPFFTTKQQGEGTGLGLSVVHGIVKSHGGAIAVESKPGKGSLFRVYLPKIETQALPDAKEAPVAIGGKERILFVDDEEILVELNQQRLTRLGYDVITTTSSTDALDIFRKEPDRFDLVVTDQTMPNLSGIDLAAELLKIKATIPIILCTGHSDSLTPERAQAAGIKTFLMKPLGKRELAAAIRRALDAKTEG